MKKVLALIVCLILSLVIVFVLPNFISEPKAVDFGSHINEKSVINQKIINKNSEEHDYNKIYNAGKLVGVVNDIDHFYELINSKYKKYESEFPGTSLSLSSDIYVVPEKSKLEFENIDEKIVEYLDNNNLLGLKAKMVDISDSDGNLTSIFVSSSDIFNEAEKKYISYFVSSDTVIAKNNGIEISSPTEEGQSVDMDYKVIEDVQMIDIIAPPEEVYSTVDEVFDFLCYGQKGQKQYYEIKEGETLLYVGQQFETSPQILMMLNDAITSPNQILVPGTELSVVPNWQLTVEVTTQKRTDEVTLPEAPIYIEDDSLKKGEIDIIIQEETGIDNVLVEDVYVNGLLQRDENNEIIASRVIERETVKEAIQGSIVVGSMTPRDFGTGIWGWPTANPIYTCGWTCYAGHGGIDIQNRSNFWGEVLAADNGVVVAVGYTDIGGYYARIDHNNGYITYYGHMRTFPYVQVGDIVERGEVIGPIGDTGNAKGPHVHFAMYRNGSLIDPCTVMACDLIPHGAYEK